MMFYKIQGFIKLVHYHDIVFRCVRQERISIRGSVRPSVGPSVGRSVRPSRLCKKRVSRLFLATVRSYTETNDQPTCFESLFTRLFVHLSLHTYICHMINTRGNSSQDHAKIMISYRPFRTRPILGWGIHSDHQKWSQNNISIPIGYLKGPDRAFLAIFSYFLL